MIIVDTETKSIRDISINEIVNRINSDVGFSDNEYVYYNHEQYYKNKKEEESSKDIDKKIVDMLQKKLEEPF